MSERGRGSEPLDEEFDGDDAAEQPSASGFVVPPPAPRPIAPYDPYRPASSAPATRRNVAAEGIEVRRPRGDQGPFLPDDDPLSAEAWQLELGEAAYPEDELDGERLDPAPEPQAPRRPRRQPAAARAQRESGAAVGRAPRRTRPQPAARPRAAVTLTMPRAVSGASLVSDQTMQVLLGINLVSVLVMAVVLGLRLGGLPASVVLRLDAAGNPAVWGPPSVLWRLPLMSLFITAMFLAVAWFIHPLDRFAARFALAAAVIAQIVAWAAIILHLR